jgi:predicted nucleic acid-binding Zn ribbon protein
VRRPAPRPLQAGLDAVVGAAAPEDLLARVQGVWADVAGAAVAEESAPLSERGGVVTVACRSAVWAQELELLGRDLVARLNARLGDPASVSELRFRTVSGGLP